MFGVSRAELQDDNESLRSQVTDLQQQLGSMAMQLDAYRAAEKIMPDFLQAIDDFKSDSLPEIAATRARDKVFAQETRRLTETATTTLIAERRHAYQTEFAAERGPAIIDGLRATFASDGTFAGVESEVRDAFYANARTEIIDERRRAIEEDLNTPENRQKIEDEIVAAEEPKLADYREQRRRENQATWSKEAIRVAQERIDQDEEARKEAIIEELVSEYLASHHGVNYRDRKKRELRDKWRQISVEDAKQHIDNDELLTVINEWEEREGKKMAETLAAEQLLAQFTNGGIETTTLEANQVISVYLGHTETKKEKVREPNLHGYHQEVMKDIDILKCQRKLTFTSLGDGLFVVETDSIAEAKSPYIAKAAIPSGTVVALGRKIINRSEKQLDRRIAAGANLFYDDDTDTPDFVDTHLPVANVEIDGVSARHYDKLDMV